LRSTSKPPNAIETGVAVSALVRFNKEVIVKYAKNNDDAEVIIITVVLKSTCEGFNVTRLPKKTYRSEKLKKLEEGS
jgi:hypothetical protein